jgi:GH15 family glucan-1,4-alpha-glucosidase
VSAATSGIDIAEYALLGDCRGAALVSSSGSIDWCCLPRFDSGSVFARLLDPERGGYWQIAPHDHARSQPGATHRAYLDGTLVLETTFQTESGSARLLDCLSIPARDPAATLGSRLVRVVEGIRGSVDFVSRIVPRFDYCEVRPWIRGYGDQLHTAIGGNDGLIIWSDAGLQEEPEPHELSGRFTVHAGDRIRSAATYASPWSIGDPRSGLDPGATDPGAVDDELERTIAWWREWSARVSVAGEDRQGVSRSALVLKALTYEPTGAIVAAPTTSLPEAIPGERNWDYRYAWVRDASFSSRAFAEIGCSEEANAFRVFIMRASAGHADELQIAYGVGGERRIGNQQQLGLEGYRRTGPVRSGNSAARQLQLDSYGELVNLTWRWHRRGHSPDDDDWRFLVSLIDRAAEQWQEPDHGLWEWPGDPDHFVQSKVTCWAALDRGLQLAEECLRRAPTRKWRRARDDVREAVETHGYDADRGVFTQAFGRTDLDCALLLLPTVEFVPWDDERMVRTVAAIRDDLSAGDGLLYRYRRDDQLPGDEGAFLCCSFWLVECLARAGDLSEAREVYEKACAAANDLGLFSEEFDPRSGELRGNFPQGLTHLAHIAAAVALAERVTPTR